MKNSIKRIFLFTLFTLFTFSAHNSIKKLTIDEAVSTAFKHRPKLQAFKYAIQASTINEKRLWTDYYPSVTLTSDHTQSKGQQNFHSTTLIKANQLIYDFAGPQARVAKARKETEIVELDEQTIKNNIQLAVEKTYLNAWLLQEQRKNIKALKKASAKTFDKIFHQNELALLDKNDFLSGAETHAQNISIVEQFDDAARSIEKQLEFLMGKSFKLNFDQHNECEQITYLCKPFETLMAIHHINFYRQKALKNRPEIKQQQKKVEIQQEIISIAAKTRMPRFNVHADVGRQDLWTETRFNKAFHSFGGTVSWNIFDQLKSDYQIEHARAQKLEAMLRKQEIEISILSEVETAYYALTQERTKLRAEKFSINRARNQFERKKQEISIGIISKTTFQEAKNFWEEARFAWVQQLTFAAIKERELVHRCGYLE